MKRRSFLQFLGAAPAVAAAPSAAEVFAAKAKALDVPHIRPIAADQARAIAEISAALVALGVWRA